MYITGGTGAVSTAVENQVKALHVSNNPSNAFINVIRLGGHDRYDTNKVVNENNFQSANTVLLASGNGFADALALGPIAYRNNYPLILTGGQTLGSTETTQLNDFNPTNVVIAGGLGVVSQAMEDSLKAKGYNVARLAGQDRTLTAAAVATWASTGIDGATGIAGQDQGFDSDTVYITTGEMFADALSAGPVAGLEQLGDHAGEHLHLARQGPGGVPGHQGGRLAERWHHGRHPARPRPDRRHLCRPHEGGRGEHRPVSPSVTAARCGA